MCPAESVICKRDNEGKKHGTLLLWAHAACAARVILASPLDLLLSPFNSFPPSLYLYQFFPSSSTHQELTEWLQIIDLDPKNYQSIKKQPPQKKTTTKKQLTNKLKKKKKSKLKPTLISLPLMSPKYRLHVRTIAEWNCHSSPLFCKQNSWIPTATEIGRNLWDKRVTFPRKWNGEEYIYSSRNEP